mgnify:CR=1 FL=1
MELAYVEPVLKDGESDEELGVVELDAVLLLAPYASELRPVWLSESWSLAVVARDEEVLRSLRLELLRDGLLLAIEDEFEVVLLGLVWPFVLPAVDEAPVGSLE